MCGRFLLVTDPDTLETTFDIRLTEVIERRYNVAPTQHVPVVRSRAGGGREIASLRWGLMPSWAKEGFKPLINARGESVAEKPSFRSSFRSRRCVVPSSGFYEWKVTNRGKQPMLITPVTSPLFAFAGIWEAGSDPSFAIITTEPNELMVRIHNRMPVILDPAGVSAWLDPATTPEVLQCLLVPCSADLMQAVPVSDRANNVRNDDPSLIEPVSGLLG